jgi:YebC/PmpR family DNA-binding regulatory protein
VAAKLGGGIVEDNPRLRAAVDKALGSNMTRDTIDRAIKRGAGQDEADNLEEITYEGYAPGGVAILVECLTDNRNRTVAEVRHAFTKFGGNLGTDGSVNYLFTKRGELYYPEGTDEDTLLEAGIEAGADDVVTQADRTIEVYTAPEPFMAVKDALVAAGLTPERAEIVMSPATTVTIDDIEVAGQVFKMLERLEDLDDVQNVYSNVDFTEEALASFE